MTKVLVISDHRVVRSGLRALLEEAGDLEVVGESAPETASAEAEKYQPDVVIVDVGADSDDEAIWVLAGERGASAVVAIGQSAAAPLVRQTLQAGARAFLLWDTAAEELAAAVRSVAQGLVVLHPAVAEALVGEARPQPGPTGGEALSPREQEVLHLLAQGLPSKTIAARLRLSEHTVKFHISSIMTKLGAASRTEAVALALRRGLIAL